MNASLGPLNRFILGGVLLSCLFLNGCYSIFFTQLNSTINKDGYTQIADIEFNQQHELKLDIYQPVQALEGAPVVVFFYGGSWNGGKREWYEFVGAALAQQGVLTLIPDYRVYPEVTFPDFMYDAASAIAWAEAHAVEYGGDSKNLFISGHSAGAQIAALLGADDAYLESAGYDHNNLSGIMGLSGPYDFSPITADEIKKVFPGEKKEHDAQAINFASNDDPPMLLLHGRDDSTVWESNSINMANALQNAGGKAKTRLYATISHSELLLSLAENRQDQTPAIQDMLNFISEQTAP